MADLDIDYIVHNIQKILDKTHSNEHKRKINTSKSDRITFACPICGDSHKDMHKKRGHLFFNNLYYRCYNEGCRSNFTKLCKDYNVHIDNNKKMEIINYIDLAFHKYAKRNDDWLIDNLDKFIKLDDLIKWFNDGEGPLHSFGPIKKGSKQYNYLLSRGFNHDLIENNFYSGIKNNGKWDEPYIVFLNKLNDSVIGMQERNISSKYKRFKIWTFKELYESIYKTDLDTIEAISYNKLSYLFNFFNINYDSDITIFEGYLDSLFMPNSIGAVGINTDFSILTNDELNIRFFFDNDNIGRKKSISWLKKGYPVFLWDKLINDLAKKYNDPYKYKIWFHNNIKDLNDLMQKEKIHYKELYKYFSSNQFDIIYITINKKINTNKNKEENINKKIDINTIITNIKYGKLNKK